MDTRGRIAVPLAYAMVLSSATSTISLAAVDFGPYFNVGKREVKFIISLVSHSTLTTTANVSLYESSSASTANTTSTLCTAILGADGSTGTWSSTADSSTAFEWQGVVTKRYVSAKYNGATTTGSHWGITVVALPQTRSA